MIVKKHKRNQKIGFNSTKKIDVLDLLDKSTRSLML